MFEYFSKIYREVSSFIPMGQEERLRYKNNNIHFLSYLAHFFLEREMIQTKVV